MSGLTVFREKYPQYKDLTDEEVVDGLYDKYYSNLDLDEYHRQMGFNQPKGVDYYAGVPVEMGKGLVRGFGSGLLSAGAGLAELADVGTDLIGLDDLIDSGDENELIRLANEGKQALNESLGLGDAYKDNYLVKLSEGLGSIGSFFVPGGAFGLGAKGLGAAARGQRIAATVGATGAGVGAGASEQADRVAAARARGEEVSAGQEDLAIALGGFVGASEAIAPLNVLKKIARFKNPRKNEEAFNAVSSAVAEGVVEGTQEVAASLLQNAIEDGVYSDNVNYTESLWDDFTVGAGSGALLDAITSGVTRRRSKMVLDAEREREQAFRDEDEKASQDLYDMAEAAKLKVERDSVVVPDPLYGTETFEGEQFEFDPAQPYLGRQVNMIDRAAEYASQIARSGIQKDGAFPESGKFDIVEDKLPGGSVFKVVHSETGEQFGQPEQERESAIHLMANLNQELINRRVNDSVIDSLDLAPEAYTPEQSESLYVIGQKLNRPKRFTVTSAVLNEAAGTTQSPKSPYQENQTIDQLHTNQYGVPPYSDKGEKLYRDLSNLTAAQEINFDRRKKGLPEVQEFTLEEAKQVLGDKYSNVFDVLVGVSSPDMTATTENFGSVGARLAASRQEYQDQKRTLEEVSSVLQEKNIASSVDSPEVGYLLEKIVNETNVESMSPSQRMYLVQELRKLPVVAQPASLPDFRPKTYTRKQYNAAVQYVTETGDGTVENIESQIGDIGSAKRTRKVASDLQKAIKKTGLINNKDEVVTRTTLPAPERFEPEIKPYVETVSEDAANLEKLLNEDLKGMGLDDIRVRVLDELKIGPVTRKGELILAGKEGEDIRQGTEGYYRPRSNTVFLALDRIKQQARDQTPEARREALTEILDHEIVHGVRNLDLWKEKEWRLLENLTRKKIFPGRGNVTFFNDAQERYPDLSAVGQMEEAVAEIIRYGRKDKKLITGKPKSLVERMYSFFEKTGNALGGTGFQSFDDVLTRLEKGEIGSRERDRIRTLQATEKRLGAVPDRGIGLSRDVKVLTPETEEEEISASRQRDRAAEQGFDTNTTYYHGTGKTNIKKFRSNLAGSFDSVTNDIIAGHFTVNPEFANVFAPDRSDFSDPENAADAGTVYPVYLRQGNSFDPGRISREKDSGGELQALSREVDNLSSPVYKSYADKMMEQMGYSASDTEARDSIINGRRKQLQGIVGSITQSPSDVGFAELEALSPFVRSAGYDSYVDYENSIQDMATGIAMFKPSDIKGVHAQYDPSGVPQGYEYADDIMFSRQGTDDTIQEDTTGGVSDEQARRLGQRNRDRGRRLQSRSFTPLEGAPAIQGATGPIPEIAVIAEEYAEDYGLPERKQRSYVKVPKDRGERLAKAYDEMRNDPQNPAVKKAYKDLIRQTKNQYKALTDAGYEFTFYDSESDPYDGNPFNAMRDLRATKSMAVYGTYDGYGTEGITDSEIENNPMLEDTGLRWKDQSGDRKLVTANDLFRAVHDAFGHGIEGSGFRARGEENAWQAHAKLFTGPALQALTSETRGQNSWLNYGPYAENNRTAKIEDTVFAEQKIGLMPDWTWTEGLEYEDPVTESRARVESKDELKAAEQKAAEFSERNPPNTIMNSLDNSPEVQQSIIDQEILGEPFSFQTKGYSFKDKFVFWAADKFTGLKDAEREINKYRASLGLRPLKATESAYIGEESISGILGNKMRRFEDERKKPLAKKIADSGYSLDEVDEFLILRHAIERNEKVAIRDSERDVELNPGSGKLKTGQTLTNSFVKRKMKERYDMDWNSSTGTWSGGNGRGKKLQSVAADVDKIVNETIDGTIEGGLIDKDSAEAIRSAYKYYAPLRGKDIEDDYAENLIIGSSISTKGKEFLRAMGRESAAQSPLGHVLLNAERSMARGTKNKQFGERLVNLVKSSPDAEFWRVISPEDPRYMRAFEKKFTYVGNDKDLQGQTFSEIPPDANRKDYIQKIVLKRDNLSPGFDKDLIGVKLDGQQVYVELADKRLRDAILGMDSGTADNLIQKFGVVNRFLSMMNTSLNPEFVIGNFSRDVQTAIFNILGEQDMSQGKAKDQKLVAKVIKDVIPSMGVFYKAARNFSVKDGTFVGNLSGIDPADQADVREYMESGAKADWFHSRPPEDQTKTIQSMIDMANGTFKGNFQRRYQAVMKFVEDGNASVENAVRLATFKASRDELLNAGVPRPEALAQAASLAKNLTINFNRKGNAGDLVNSLYLFFNASVQGTANFARGLFGPNMNPFSSEASRVKQGAVTSLIMFGALSALRAEEESEENPETGRSYYSEIPDYVKERNIVIMAEPSEALKKGASNIYLDRNGKEYANKTQYYYTIPLPYGYNVFHSLGQNVFEMSNGHISPLKATSNVTSAFLGSFSPIGFSSPAPTIAQPFIEIAKNENFFGSPIYRENFPTGTQLPESSMSMSTTRTPFKWMAKLSNSLIGGNEQQSGALDVSPDVLEHLAEFALGGAGQFGMRNLDAFEKWQKGEDLKAREIPFLRRIKGEPDERVSMGDFYERKIKLEQLEARLDVLRGADRINFRKNNAQKLRTLRDLERAEDQLRKLREQRKRIKAIASRSPQDALKMGKAEEEVYDRMNSVYNRFNKSYDKKVGRTN